MAETFTAKVRPIGSSLCVIIPRKIVEKEKIKPGKEIEVSVINQNFRLLESLAGTVEEKYPFVRDRRDRV